MSLVSYKRQTAFLNNIFGQGLLNCHSNSIEICSEGICQHWLSSQAIIWSNGGPCFWRINTSLYNSDVIMGAIASQITSLTIVYSTVYSDVDQRKHQSSASLAFVHGIHRGPANSPHKWPVTRKMFPFDDVIMTRPQLVDNTVPRAHMWNKAIVNSARKMFN